MLLQAVRIQTVRAKCDALAQDLKDAHDNHVNSLHAQVILSILWSQTL